MRRWRKLATWTVELPTTLPDAAVRCQGRACRGKPIPEGETCTELYDESMALARPWDPEGRRFACASCTARATA